MLALLSGRGGPEAERAERAVRDTGAELTILRSTWFMQNFSEDYMRDHVLDRRRRARPRPQAAGLQRLCAGGLRCRRLEPVPGERLKADFAAHPVMQKSMWVA